MIAAVPARAIAVLKFMVAVLLCSDHDPLDIKARLTRPGPCRAAALPSGTPAAYKARDDGKTGHIDANYSPGALTPGAAGPRCRAARTATHPPMPFFQGCPR
jgi:hypothetical protein